MCLENNTNAQVFLGNISDGDHQGIFAGVNSRETVGNLEVKDENDDIYGTITNWRNLFLSGTTAVKNGDSFINEGTDNSSGTITDEVLSSEYLTKYLKIIRKL